MMLRGAIRRICCSFTLSCTVAALLTTAALPAAGAGPGKPASAPAKSAASSVKPANAPGKPAGVAQAPKPTSGPTLLTKALKAELAEHSEIIFAVREAKGDGHWYANFGYYCADESKKAYGALGKLCRLDLRTGKLKVLLDDPQGSVRDPQVHYDGKTILFSYRKGGSECFNLYEIQSDGTGLRQVTSGAFDDIEPTYLPDGDIVFVSSRAKRWVNCWLTQVAVMYRCDRNGGHMRIISGNIEHDNTPWVMNDGRLLYTRWEYVDRNQVSYHHLWASNPDGSNVMTWFGNMYPGIVMIDAKPLPGSDKAVAIFSPGHGHREHAGPVAIVDPTAGPDAPSYAHKITKGDTYRDPYPLSDRLFLAARDRDIVLLDIDGAAQLVYTIDGPMVHEPRPLCPRQREPVIPSRADVTKATGRLVLSDVNYGRNMNGVKPGEIKKLLVLESLPKPVNFSGGMEPLTQGGSFTLERIVGTVPVEADGSAYIELPALRSFFFVALDEKDLSVKRMQSFLSVQPGEVQSCAGCHEQRYRLPEASHGGLMALRREPSVPEPIADVPEVMDFPRDIQPILNKHCLKCHDNDKRDGGVNLSGDRGPMYSLSYTELTAFRQVADGRNSGSNREPRSIGSSASPLLAKLSGKHHGVQASAHEYKMVRLWIETGAPYPGTYAALGSGMIGRHIQNVVDETGADDPAIVGIRQAVNRRCVECHKRGGEHGIISVSPWIIAEQSRPQFGHRFSRDTIYNLTHPEKSVILLAPLAPSSGGLGICRGKSGAPVFAGTNDADYRMILTGVQSTKAQLDRIKRFDMPGFRPNYPYLREMKRYGILPPSFDVNKDPVDPYVTDRAYWRSLWWEPVVVGDAQ